MAGAALTAPDGISEDGELLRLTVNLTEANLKAGRPANCLLCPWALAVCEALEAAGIKVLAGAPVVVRYSTVNIAVRWRHTYLGPTTARMRWAIQTFDHGDASKIKPMTVRLQLRRRERTEEGEA